MAGTVCSVEFELAEPVNAPPLDLFPGFAAKMKEKKLFEKRKIKTEISQKSCSRREAAYHVEKYTHSHNR